MPIFARHYFSIIYADSHISSRRRHDWRPPRCFRLLSPFAASRSELIFFFIFAYLAFQLSRFLRFLRDSREAAFSLLFAVTVPPPAACADAGCLLHHMPPPGERRASRRLIADCFLRFDIAASMLLRRFQLASCRRFQLGHVAAIFRFRAFGFRHPPFFDIFRRQIRRR